MAPLIHASSRAGWLVVYCSAVGRYSADVADDRLYNSYVSEDCDLPAVIRDASSGWTAEFTNTAHRHSPPNQLIPVEQFWARDFLGRQEHDVWWV